MVCYSENRVNHTYICYVTWQRHSWSFILEKWKVVFTQQLVYKHVSGGSFWSSAKLEVNHIPSISEKLDKLWYINMIELYSAIKRNKLFRYNYLDESPENYTEGKTIFKKLNMAYFFLYSILDIIENNWWPDIKERMEALGDLLWLVKGYMRENSGDRKVLCLAFINVSIIKL